MKKSKFIVFCGIATAIISVLAQVSFPFGTINLTLQTFAISLCALLFSWKISVTSVLIYILLGLIGVPVFSGFSGGLSVLAGPSGGFIFGFLPMAFFMGLFKKYYLKIPFCAIGLFCCYFFGCVQFSFITSRSFYESFALVCTPFIIKDVVSVAIAYFVSVKIKKYLNIFE